jgi:Cu(I)/Ag(I) efflux system membrane protein CusA/SilA
MGSADAGADGGMGAAPAAQIPLGQLGQFKATMGPPMIKSEGGLLTGWVYVDITSRDIGGYVKSAKLKVARELKLIPGTYLKWTGQYEFLERIQARMKIVVPLTLLLIFLILYLNFQGLTQALIVLLSVPFAAVGSIWLMYLMEFNTSMAVWVGMIALLGIATETASIMMVYLDQGYETWRKEGRLHSMADLIDMAVESATLRVRPLVMTVGMNIVGLIPVMVDTGVGSDVAKRVAAPLWGGLISLTILTLAVIPAFYVIWRGFQLRRAVSGGPPVDGEPAVPGGA